MHDSIMLLSMVGMAMISCTQAKVRSFMLKNYNLSWKIVRKRRSTMRMNLARNVITMMV